MPSSEQPSAGNFKDRKIGGFKNVRKPVYKTEKTDKDIVYVPLPVFV